MGNSKYVSHACDAVSPDWLLQDYMHSITQLASWLPLMQGMTRSRVLVTTTGSHLGAFVQGGLYCCQGSRAQGSCTRTRQPTS
jgi:hypothetical protein